MLKALTGSTWGCDKETLLTTYQAIGGPIFSYCCPVWTPSHKDTNWSRLQRAKNSALLITTGCLKMANVAELHQEAWELPVRQHNELISQQFTIACHLPQHPCHQLCHRPPDDRPERRRSLIGRFKPNIQQYLANEPLSNTSYKSAISNIHQDAVRTTIESYSKHHQNIFHQNYLIADRRPLPQPNRHCHGRQELYGHNFALVTSKSLVST